MAAQIELVWPRWKEKIRAALLTDLNPELCRQFMGSLPLESIQSHAVVAGQQIYFPCRFIPATTQLNYEMMDQQPVGRINLEVDFQYLAIQYGPSTEPVRALPIAQVDEADLDRLKQIGEKSWYNLLFSEEYIRVHVIEAGDQHGQ